MTFSMAAALVGGIGLFLLGMRLMTDGLKYAAGESLRKVLARSTETKVRGLIFGCLMTSVVQSSSAVTVATIGFVNAGMMQMSRAVAVVYGSNIGTTMTAWLVALVGFNVNIKAIALPGIGIGMLLRTVWAGHRRGAFGEALAGFGLFFIGIEEMSSAFSGLGQGIQLEALLGSGIGSLLMFVLLGFVLTFLMQSSSASMAIALTAAAGGVVPMNAAAAMVIGANVGTTSTAVLSVIGATPNAKRIAAAHVVFNLGTGLVAFLLLPILLNNVGTIRSVLGLADDATVFLALFHSTFNVLGVLLFYPLTEHLVTILNGMFRSIEEDESRPRYLDRTIVATPDFALAALIKEVARIGEIAKRMAKGAISSEITPGPRLQTDMEVLDKLVDASADFSNLMQRSNLPPEMDDMLPNVLRVTGYYTIVAEVAIEVAKQQSGAQMEGVPELSEALSRYKGSVVAFLGCADGESEEFQSGECLTRFQTLQEEYRLLKSRLLRAGTKGEISARLMVHILELISNVNRISEQSGKAAVLLGELRNHGNDVPKEIATEPVDEVVPS